jgi:hypothetical protein
LFPAGLVEHVTKVLELHGYIVRVRPGMQNTYHFPHRQPDQPNWQCPEFLRRAYRRRYSLGVILKLSDRVSTIAALCEQFPRETVLVVSKNSSEARSVARRLSQRTRRKVTWGGLAPRWAYPWLHVDSVSTFFGRSFRDWRFVVFLDAETLVTKTCFEQHLYMSGSTFMGFLLREPRELNQWDRAFIEGALGPVIYCAQDEYDWTKVAVACLPAPAYPATRATDPLGHKRGQIWHNDHRNRLLARTARAFNNLDVQGLARLGLDQAGRWLAALFTARAPTVAIVVESLEHGRELAQLLPDWRLEPALDNHAKAKIVIDFQRDNVITTLTRVQTGILVADVVIYAAGYGRQWLRNLGPYGPVFNQLQMLIVDIADDCDAACTCDRVAREAIFLRHGWQLL